MRDRRRERAGGQGDPAARTRTHSRARCGA
jgi:hypothetical protein